MLLRVVRDAPTFSFVKNDRVENDWCGPICARPCLTPLRASRFVIVCFPDSLSLARCSLALA